MNGRLYQLAALLALLFLSQAAVAKSRTILAFGDSLTAGYQLRPGEGFAPQLQKALRAKGRDVTVINAGVSGDTTAQGKARIAWGLQGLKTKPDLVIVELGANDMLRGQSPATAKANLDAIIKDFKARGVRVLLAGMLAQPNLGATYARDFNALYPALAKANKVALYPFFMDGVAAVPGMQLSDGLHPTPKGLTVIVNKITPFVLRELDALPG
ncbi:arylesterase [Polymorphobacter fuscus]|uniref:Arylesterase n=2 Tax=Sandarakinorhabdus fusca TaxID=1439888 RepID=A0A7C9GMI9_9SPHN|nr:arylesterase [Polymorphobacter fuscus]KAB7649062.1 arylesterase [Polymorphobacter fuscus]MQT16052.1 arylesterase [Polymorphobacter fuscus]